MANVHVGHDCVLGDRILVANNTMFAGHIHVESFATISGGVGMHQFVTIGAHSYIGGLSRIVHDVPPYMLVEGNPSKVRCINVVGLKRQNLSAEAIASLHEAHRLIYRARMTAQQAAEILESHGHLARKSAACSISSKPSSRASTAGPGNAGGSRSMKRLRVGVVGVGHLGQHHARILASMPDVELVAVADSRLEQAQTVAAAVRHARPRQITDELLGKVDAVSIAVPTVLHREVAGAFLARGISDAGREATGRLARRGRAARVAGPRHRGPRSRSATSNASTPPSRPSADWPSAPSTSRAERLSTYTFRSTDIGVVLDLMIHDIDLVLSLIAAPVRSVAAVGVSLFGEHEDVANARIEFEDGTVANLTASRASYTAMRKMRIWGTEGYASLDFAARQATLVQPSEEFLRGELDLDGVDLGQPSAVKEHLFGKILRVDQVQTAGREPLALELEDFVQAARGPLPRVSGEDALRAMRVADQVLRSLEAHRWDGDATTLPAPAQPAETGSLLRGPHAWQTRKPRPTPKDSGH